MERDLNPRCKEEISDAAALAVVLDLRPMGFTENREGMAAYAKAVFSAGQSVPVGIPINAKSYLPSRTAIKSSLDRLEVKLCAIFSKELRTNLLSQGGAVSVDGVTLKLQGKQYYDFTIHHISMKRPANVVSFPTFGIRTSTILFLEGPAKSDGESIRNLLDVHLKEKYGIGFDSIHGTFTLVTDGAGNMARMAGSSTSRRIAPLDQRWMRCFVHVLSISMKNAVQSCARDSFLVKVFHDFKAMKSIVRDAKQSGWNHLFPIGYHLIQEVETRFGTHFLVAQRFLKSAEKTWDLIESHGRSEAKSVFQTIEKQSSPSKGYPTIEALVDALRPVYEATIMFQAANVATLHKEMPTLQHCMTELSSVEIGGSVLRENNQSVRPTLFSTRLCGVMQCDLMKVEIHDLWLVACFLFPFLRDMEFWKSSIERADFQCRAEMLTGSMCVEEETASESIPSVQNEADGTVQDNGTQSDAITSQQSTPAPVLKKRHISLMDHVASTDVSEEDRDEVRRYKETPLRQMGLDRDTFLTDPFSVIKFWYARKRSFPKLYKVAMRIFATPASSCASERVFSILKKVVTPDRSVLTTKHISQILVSRSLRHYQD